MPNLSIIMPVKNGEQHIRSAIRSTLAHMPSDAELVVADDGSTDGTTEILEQERHPRFRWSRQDESRGVGATLASLVAATDSFYIARMDADDICLPGRFSQQRAALQADVDVCFTSIVRFHNAIQSARPGLPLPITADAMPLHFLMFNPLCHPTMMGKRSTIERVGGYRPVKAEDHDLWLRLLSGEAKLHRIAAPGLAYRHHVRQVSRSEGFALDALSDPIVRRQYSILAEYLLSTDAPWLDTLWPLPGNSQPPSFESLKSLLLHVDRLALELSPVQRWVLHRTRRHIVSRINYLERQC